MTTLSIEPVQQYAAQCASIRRPREITHFSYDEDHQYRPDDSGILFYYPPRLGSDLSAGFDTFNKLDDTRDDHLNHLLDSIIEYEKRSSARVDVDLVTWRGMLTKIMTAPFEKFDGLVLRCGQSVITYLEEDHAAKLRRHQEQHARPSRTGSASQDMMSYWGYKFEAISVLSQPWTRTSRTEIEARGQQTVSNHAQYVSVVKTAIGKTRMILGGEVDAIRSERAEVAGGEPLPWIELKTSATIQNARDEIKFERKLLKFWAQSFLLGIPTIVVGFRDDKGILCQLEEMDTQEIPDLVASRGRSWDAKICLNFAAAFLDWLGPNVDEGFVYHISRPPKSSDVTIRRVSSATGSDGTAKADGIMTAAFLEWRRTFTPAITPKQDDARDSVQR